MELNDREHDREHHAQETQPRLRALASAGLLASFRHASLARAQT
jgi:hypothetical protein